MPKRILQGVVVSVQCGQALRLNGWIKKRFQHAREGIVFDDDDRAGSHCGVPEKKLNLNLWLQQVMNVGDCRCLLYLRTGSRKTLPACFAYATF